MSEASSPKHRFVIGIIGFGFVGRATALFAEHNTDVDLYIYDRREDLCQPPGTTLDDLKKKCDWVFVCVPTPQSTDGSCCTKSVEQCVRAFEGASCRVVVRSTVPPGFCQRLGCLFMPEFLTERTWRDDFHNASHWILGMNHATTDEREISDNFLREFRAFLRSAHKDRLLQKHQKRSFVDNPYNDRRNRQACSQRGACGSCCICKRATGHFRKSRC